MKTIKRLRSKKVLKNIFETAGDMTILVLAIIGFCAILYFLIDKLC